jgi:general secretion pathway protein G
MSRTSPRTPPPPAAAGASGFTLLELIIVVAIIGILATIVLPQLRDKPIRAKEAVLKTNLARVRDVIDQYYADKGKYPPSLEALVDEKYLRTVPLDPITGRNDSWVLIYEELDEEAPPLEIEEGEGGPGVVDIKSGSERVSLGGTPYAEW